ncbi:DUF2059 domain-containing protein, partial [bacterium]|nr:DUF2059 domain-containing protein [bacterium]
REIRRKLIDHTMRQYSKKNRVAFMSENSQDLDKYLKFEVSLKKRLSNLIKDEISLYNFSLKLYSKMYLKYFSKKELKVLLSFYKSSTGKKFVKVNSNVMNGVQSRLGSFLNKNIAALNKKMVAFTQNETNQYLKDLKK